MKVPKNKKKPRLRLRKPKSETTLGEAPIVRVPTLEIVQGGRLRSTEKEEAPDICMPERDFKVYSDVDFPIRTMMPCIPLYLGKEVFHDDLKYLTPKRRRAVILEAVGLEEKHLVPYPTLDPDDPDFDKKFSFDLWMNDYRYGIESFMKINTKEQGIIPFKLNIPQLVFFFNRVGKDVILKARQHGFTTLVVAIYLLDTMQNVGRKTTIVTHEKQATKELLATIKLMYDSLPNMLKPPLVRDNSEFMEFEGMQGASIRVETIKRTSSASDKSGGTGRSKMIHNLLLSEPAFYDGIRDSDLLGLTESVPVSGSTTIESTPNGIGGYYHAEVKHAKSGKGARKLFILHWFINPDYDESWKFAKRKERQLLEGTPNGDQNWEQEYGCNFRMSQSSYFEEALWAPRAPNSRIVKDQMGAPYEPYVHIYQEPLLDHYYVIGADTAQGFVKGDYSSATVIDRETGEEVAHLYGHMEPEDFAVALHWLGYKYNEAFLGVENEKNGAVVLHILMNDDRYFYYNLYFYQNNEASRNNTRGVPGFSTNVRTRRVMLTEFRKNIREEAIYMAFPPREAEMSTFVVINGKPQAATDDDYDDTIISGAIASRLLDYPDVINRNDEVEFELSEIGR